MQIEQTRWSQSTSWIPMHPNMLGDGAQLVLLFGSPAWLKQRIEKEVEGVRDILGQKPVLAGFHSYGEISPFSPAAQCEPHNQTMAITTLSEF